MIDQTGKLRIEQRFKDLKTAGRSGLVTFITAGDPNKNISNEILKELPNSGADLIEIGMPFSDPLADGPVIQASSQRAIKNRVNVSWILETVLKIRKQSEIPIALMGYINPIINYGLNTFILDCNSCGVDGLIIPDLPPEEAEDFVNKSKENSICPILLVEWVISLLRGSYGNSQ